MHRGLPVPRRCPETGSGLPMPKAASSWSRASRSTMRAASKLGAESTSAGSVIYQDSVTNDTNVQIVEDACDTCSDVWLITREAGDTSRWAYTTCGSLAVYGGTDPTK